jgi:hypothetical protein
MWVLMPFASGPAGVRKWVALGSWSDGLFRSVGRLSGWKARELGRHLDVVFLYRELVLGRRWYDLSVQYQSRFAGILK